MPPRNRAAKNLGPSAPVQGELLQIAKPATSHDGIIIPAVLDPNSKPGFPEPLSIESAPDTQVSEPTEFVAETTDVRERARHLLGSLNLLARANRGRGFLAISYEDSPHRPELEEKYGEGEALNDFISEVAHNKNHMIIAARKQFLKAYETGNGEITNQEPEFTTAWAAFYRRFDGTRNRKARDAQRDRYKQITSFIGPRLSGDTYTLESEPATKIPGTLTKQEKLDIFQEDARLQFAPATNREEEQARRALNYMDKPHGIFAMLNEIARKRYKDTRKRNESDYKAKEEGKIARRSVLHTWGSYLANAKESLGHLSDLEAKLAEIEDPETPLVDVAGVDHPALAVLVRDVDYDAFRKGGKSALPFDPLRTREDRSPQANPERNKTVEDRYTGHETDVMIQDQIRLWAEATTVGDLVAQRRLEKTTVRQQNRGRFWDGLLQNTEGGDKRIANAIRQENGLTAA